jgi:alpha-ketoglutarate-dependent taurine dioxygenase
VIELQEGSTENIHAVNYSPPFQGPLPLMNSATPEDSDRLSRLHEALRLFADGCDDSRNRYEVQLQPGDCVIFDNRRVLHARTAFEWTEGEEAEGVEKGRWLKGAYCDGDEVRSKWRTLQGKSERGNM